MRRVAILGATGSIGASTLDVLAALPEHFELAAVSGHLNGQALCDIVRRFGPAIVGVTGGNCDATALVNAARLGGQRVPIVLAGAGALEQIATSPNVDVVVSAVVGAAGLRATLAATAAGKRVCLANKESLVVGGHLVMPMAAQSGAEVLPVDSEHSAIFQAMLAGRRSEVSRVILTASGGPFRGRSRSELIGVTVEQALAHPTWKMGSKITIDSATLVNKALEIIEAYHLFGLHPDQLSAVVHPQSIVHSFVEFLDGSTLAQLSPPDMRLPIQYALTHPHRLASPARRIDFATAQQWEFTPVDDGLFPAIRLAGRVLADLEAGRSSAGAIFNAANEVAVDSFLRGKIAFLAIVELVERVMDAVSSAAHSASTLEGVEAIDAEVRQRTREMIDASKITVGAGS